MKTWQHDRRLPLGTASDTRRRDRASALPQERCRSRTMAGTSNGDGCTLAVMWGLPLVRLAAACPAGMDPCNDGPTPGSSRWLIVLVVVLVIATAICIIAAVRYVRSRDSG